MNQNATIEYKGRRYHCVVGAFLTPAVEGEDWKNALPLPARIIVPRDDRQPAQYILHTTCMEEQTLEAVFATFQARMTRAAEDITEALANEEKEQREAITKLLAERPLAAIDGGEVLLDVEVLPGEQVSISRDAGEIHHPNGLVVWIHGACEPYNAYFMRDELLKGTCRGNKVFAKDIDGKERRLLFYTHESPDMVPFAEVSPTPQHPADDSSKLEEKTES